MKKRFKIPIIITVITLVLSCFTIPVFATPTNANPNDTLYEPILYPRYTYAHLYDVDNLSVGVHATYDTSFYGVPDDNVASLQYVGVTPYNTATDCVYYADCNISYIDDLQQYAYASLNSVYNLQDELAPLNLTYYFDDIGVRGDLYENVNHQDLYAFISSYADQDRNNLLQGFTVYFTYKSYDYLADDFRIVNYQQRFNPISNTLTQYVGSVYGLDSNMLYVNPFELVKAEADANGLSLFGIISDLRIEVNLSSSLMPSIMSLSFAKEKGFNEEYTTSVRDDLYTLYGEDNSPSAEVPTDVFGWVVDCASSLFEFELMPGLSISIIFVGILGILVFIYIMKRFAGG